MPKPLQQEKPPILPSAPASDRLDDEQNSVYEDIGTEENDERCERDPRPGVGQDAEENGENPPHHESPPVTRKRLNHLHPPIALHSPISSRKGRRSIMK